MSFLAATVTLTAATTPYQISTKVAPIGASITTNGITYPSGSATMSAFQITLQSNPANTGNVFIGGPGLSTTSLNNVGYILVPGAQVTLGQYGGQMILDDVWAATATAGNTLLVSIVG